MGLYEDMLEESKRTVLTPMPGRGMASPNPSALENILATIEALDPQLAPGIKGLKAVPMVAAPLMTKWKKFIDTSNVEDPSGYRRTIQDIKKIFKKEALDTPAKRARDLIKETKKLPWNDPVKAEARKEIDRLKMKLKTNPAYKNSLGDTQRRSLDKYAPLDTPARGVHKANSRRWYEFDKVDSSPLLGDFDKTLRKQAADRFAKKRNADVDIGAMYDDTAPLTFVEEQRLLIPDFSPESIAAMKRAESAQSAQEIAEGFASEPNRNIYGKLLNLPEGYAQSEPWTRQLIEKEIAKTNLESGKTWTEMLQKFLRNKK